MKILLDTNFLLVPFTNGIDIYESLNFEFKKPELITLFGCINELEKLNQKGAIDLLKKRGVQIIEFTEGNVDDSIISFAEREGAVVATIDKPLQERIRRKKMGFIFLRQGKFPKLFQGKALKNH